MGCRKPGSLYKRAVEACRPAAILPDAQAVALVEQLDYDFRRFGTGHVAHAIRAQVLDDWVRAVLVQHPAGVVVNRGAGLDTQFTRGDTGPVRWY